MKTIEERAEEYAPDPRDPDYILYSEAGYVVNRYRDAYIVGATEQKALDIDKACRWFADYLMEIGCPDDWTNSGEERFMKAMEEEL